MNFIYSFQSEWLKTKRSAASWLVLAGGFFIPLILFFNLLSDYKTLPAIYEAPHFWDQHFSKSWQFMAFFLLPVGVILASSLITQLEYRNNTWKQLLTTPQRLTSIFFAKLLVIAVMMLQFFILFNIGIYLSGVLPSMLLSKVHYPKQPIPFMVFFKWNAIFFMDCLPIIAIQYLLSMHFKNFLVALGAGLAIFMGTLMANSWQYVYLLPFSYSMIDFMKKQGRSVMAVPVHLIATVYCIFFIIAGYILFVVKREKG